MDAIESAGRRFAVVVMPGAGLVVARFGVCAPVLVILLVVRVGGRTMMTAVAEPRMQPMLVPELGVVLQPIQNASGRSAGEHHRERNAKRREHGVQRRTVSSHEAMLIERRSAMQADALIPDAPGRRFGRNVATSRIALAAQLTPCRWPRSEAGLFTGDRGAREPCALR